MENNTKALNYLRDQARSAHLEGDGVYVNHLASIALIECQRMKQDNNLDIGLLDIKWALILPVYWLLDTYMLDLIKSTIGILDLRSDEDRKFKAILDEVIFLVEQPLALNIERLKRVSDNDLSWIDASDELEDELLLQLLIELVWYRAMLDDFWSSLGDHFKNVAPTQLKENIQNLLKRLNSQSSIIYNDPKYKDTFNSILTGTEQNIAYGWSIFLALQIPRLEQYLKNKSLRISFNSPDAVQISQLHNLYEIYIKQLSNPFHYLYYGSPTGDRAEIRISRIRYQTANRKELQFDENRKLKWLEDYQGILKKPVGNQATARFRCFRLAMMRELSALRQWNLVSWFNSIKQQYLSYEELIYQQNVSSPAYTAYNVIRLGVLSTTISKEDKTLINASYVLDNTEEGRTSRTNLIKNLVKMRPIVWPTVLTALNVLSDSISESETDSVIDFCIEIIKHPELGQKPRLAEKLSFWSMIIPFVSDTETLCQKLWPIAENIATGRASYSYEVAHFSTEYIVHSNIDLAVKYTDLFTQGLTPENNDTYDIWVTVYNALLQREDIQDKYLDILKKNAKSLLHKHYLDRMEHNLGSGPSTNPELKNEAIKLIMGQVEGVFNEGPQGFGSIFTHYIEQLQWTIDDKDIVEAVIKAINYPKIRKKEYTELLNALSIIVRQGDVGIAEMLLPELNEWLTESRYIENIFDNMNDPLGKIKADIFPDDDDLAISKIDLSLSMSIKLDEKVGESIVAWAKQLINQASNNVGANLFELLIYHSVVTNRLMDEEAEGLINILLLRISDEIEREPASSGGINLLQKINQLCVMDSDSNYIIRNYPSNENHRKIVRLIQKYLILYADSINPDIRMLVGAIIMQWNHNGIPIDNLKQIIDKLKTDARARVRFQVKEL